MLAGPLSLLPLCWVLLASAMASAGDAAQAGRTIAPEELAERIAAGRAPLILDVRTSEEFASGHLPGARNIPHDRLADRLPELGIDPDTEVAVHCHSGRRAEFAERVLREAGYTNVRDLEGHWKGWLERGLPTEVPAETVPESGSAADSAGEAVPAPAPPDDVVLLHGLGRSERAMRLLAERLAGAGFRVHNLDYPSTRATPDELVEYVGDEIARCCAGAARLHFVTHSLGGILARAYLADHALPGPGRVVMLAPPNHGSEYVDVAGEWTLFEQLLGPTATQLGTGSESFPNRLPPADFELGVIAGTRSLNPLGSAVFEGEHDGTVSVESAQLDGMRDYLELEVSHTFIMRDPEVARQAIAFLRRGRFARDVEAP